MKRAVDVVIGAKFIVGRKAEACDLAVDDRLMSKQHFRLSCRGGQLSVMDLQSLNKTFVNGAPIASERPLQPGDTITAGNTKFLVSVH